VLTTVLLDLMDVLIRDPYREALAAATRRRSADPDAWPQFEVAAIDEAEFLRRYTGGDPASFDARAFHRARRAGYRWLPGMRELVAALRGRLALHVASNYPVWIEQLRAEHGIDDLVDGVWASTHLGVRKPDPRFFTLLLQRIGASPQECLFVDDREPNVQAAAALGLRAHLFTGAKGLVRRLREEGVEVACNAAADICVCPATSPGQEPSCPPASARPWPSRP